MPIPAVPPQGDAQLNDNARTVIRKRYLVKDATGTPVEQPEDMFWRVAGTVAEADRRYGSSDSEVTAVAVMPWRRSWSADVITETAAGNFRIASLKDWRNSSDAESSDMVSSWGPRSCWRL